MSKGRIHIVCFDAPSPPNYGGVYDLYYKVQALAGLGYEIVLHYFDYKKERGTNGLEAFCTAIYKYRRRSFWKGFHSSLPYIVHSRIDADLIKRLNNDAAPLIIEGIHCTGILPFINTTNRKIVVRIPNDEAIYYQELATMEKSFIKRQYLLRESRLLLKYQATLPAHFHYSFLAQNDRDRFEQMYGLKDTSFIPVFVPWKKITGKVGRGTYCLYQGNLSVSENVKAVEWLIKNVFAASGIPFIIAGKAPNQRLMNAVKPYSNTQVLSNPSNVKLTELIQDAHIHLLPSFNKTGVKLKLLHAVFNGRFCVSNQQGIKGSGVLGGVLLAEDADHYNRLIAEYMQKDFGLQNVEQRLYLTELYNNSLSAQKLSAFL